MKYLAAVRYGLMTQTENFQSNVDDLASGMTVLVRTQRGVECGVICSPVTALDREVKGLGEILRAAGETDHNILRHIREVKEPEEQANCEERIRERNLPMKLVGVEHLVSGDKIVFYFLADGRVDFRELVKDLARRYRTRIEMRQIGVRDEARLLADYEHCGRELCCRTFLHSLEPVTMRMAKIQKTTLDPSKISGHCGRLMCCLRFEDQVYSELRRELPERGTVVATPKFEGEIIGLDVLKQSVTVILGDGSQEHVHISEIVETRGKRPRRDRPERTERPERAEKAERSEPEKREERNADAPATPAEGGHEPERTA
jgi:cell fate regulator YaaT (PSP1 superfamily)